MEATVTPNIGPIDLRVPIRASSSQVSSDLGNEVVILDLKQSAYHGLDGTGARIWALILQGYTGEQIRDTIVGEYEVDPVRCQEDVVRLLMELAEIGLIEVGYERAA